MALQPKTVALGVGLGLAGAAIFIAIDRSREPDVPEAAAESASAPPATISAPRASTSIAPSGSSAAPKKIEIDAGVPFPEGPAGMVRVNAATYQPSFLTHPVDVKAFWLDVTEVTEKAYGACVEANICRPTAWARPGAPIDPKAENQAAAELAWDDARSYCAWAKKRLPTEIEWELAARGTAPPRKYPWGEDAPADQLCWHAPKPCDVGATARDITPEGVRDLGGGVSEWTADASYCTDPDKPATCDTLRHPARGGAWNALAPQVVESTFRKAMSAPVNTLGFRCAAD